MAYKVGETMRLNDIKNLGINPETEAFILLGI